MSDKTELSIDTPEYRKLLGAVTEASQRGYAHGEADEEKWIAANRALINYIDAWNRRATIQPTAAPFGYAVEQPDGHVTFFKDDPKGFRASPHCSPDKSWAELGVKVHDLYNGGAPVAPADAVRDARLRFVFQEFLTSLPARRDWLNPDAEREMRALFNELNAAPKEPAK